MTTDREPFHDSGHDVDVPDPGADYEHDRRRNRMIMVVVVSMAAIVAVWAFVLLPNQLDPFALFDQEELSSWNEARDNSGSEAQKFRKSWETYREGYEQALEPLLIQANEVGSKEATLTGEIVDVLEEKIKEGGDEAGHLPKADGN